MSSYYEKIVFRAKEISKEIKYNFWEERANLIMSLGLLWISLALLYITIQQKEDGGLLLIIPLVSFVGSYFVIKKRQKRIVDKEMLLAQCLLNDFNKTITLDTLSSLISELDESIGNARKVAQWAIGGIITIFIFISGIFGNLFSTFLEKVEIPKVELNNALNDFQFTSVIEIIFTFTVMGFFFLAMIYALLQIHTFSKRRYKKMFKNMEYILLENKSNDT